MKLLLEEHHGSGRICRGVCLPHNSPYTGSREHEELQELLGQWFNRRRSFLWKYEDMVLNFRNLLKVLVPRVCNFSISIVWWCGGWKIPGRLWESQLGIKCSENQRDIISRHKIALHPGLRMCIAIYVHEHTYTHTFTVGNYKFTFLLMFFLHLVTISQIFHTPNIFHH